MFVAFLYRSRVADNVCHVGLGVNGVHMVKTLRKNGVASDCFAARSVADVKSVVSQNPQTTHVVIEAPWMATSDILALMRAYPRIQFQCRCHSNVGFLQVEAAAVRLVREYIELEDGNFNFRLTANCERYAAHVRQVYRCNCAFLPNLYDFDRQVRRQGVGPKAPLRISSFGALRLLKNHATAAAAALKIARLREVDLEFWVSVNREEHGKGVVDVLDAMFAGLKWAKLVKNPWEPWARFRQTVGHMDLAMQTSFTETFNLTAADAVAEGVPVVGSAAIEWLPPHWQADADSEDDIARVGMALLNDSRNEAERGLRSLAAYVDTGVRLWQAFLRD